MTKANIIPSTNSASSEVNVIVEISESEMAIEILVRVADAMIGNVDNFVTEIKKEVCVVEK